MREIIHLQVGQCGNQIGTKVFVQYILRGLKYIPFVEFFLSIS